MRYYSKTTGGFYDDALHGARTKIIDDPTWARSTYAVSDPEDETRLIEQPDADEVPRTIEVPNERCMLPEDAVAITDDQHSSLLAAQSAGQAITAASDGAPVAVERPPATAAAVRQQLGSVVQGLLDEKARGLGYDDIKTAVSYADEPAVPRFQREGRALRAWRSLVWSSFFDLLAQVDAGSVSPSTSDALLACLPPLGHIAE